MVDFWTPIYAIPLALLFLMGLAVAQRARRHGTSKQWRRHRAQAAHAGPGQRDTDFTDRDRETIYEGR